MKIGNPEGAAPVSGVANRGNADEQSKVKSKAEAKVETPATDASTHVQLSDAASALLSNNVGAGDFDAAKVARIQQSIADGTFKINPEAIADKMLANAQELLGKVTK